MKKIFCFMCATWMMCGYSGNTDFVILIPSYNNERWAEENIKSALSQKYDKFSVVYIDDASTDATLSIVKSAKEKYDIHNRMVIYANPVNVGAMKNIYEKIHEETSDEQVIVLLDGDDRLVHEHVLTILDRTYSQKYPIWATYGSQFWKSKVTPPFATPLPFQWEKSRFYRNEYATHMTAHLRTFKSWIFKKIPMEDFFYEGTFAAYSWDIAIMVPIIEMSSRGHFCVIPVALYEYNDENPISDFRKDLTNQLKMAKYFVDLPEYDPL